MLLEETRTKATGSLPHSFLIRFSAKAIENVKLLGQFSVTLKHNVNILS